MGVVECPNNDGFASGLLQSTTPVERDRFVAHLYQARREYRRTCETAGKSGKRIDRCVISTFQIAESIRFEEFRQWEDLLRFGEYRLAYSGRHTTSFKDRPVVHRWCCASIAHKASTNGS
jgi:hypothetical protein